MEDVVRQLQQWFPDVESRGPRLALLADSRQLAAFRSYCSSASLDLAEFTGRDFEDLVSTWRRAIPAPVLATASWRVIEELLELDRNEIVARARSMSAGELDRWIDRSVLTDRDLVAFGAVRSELGRNSVDCGSRATLSADRLVTELVALVGPASPAVLMLSRPTERATTSAPLAEAPLADVVELATRFAIAARSVVVGVAASKASVDSYFDLAPESAAKALARRGRLRGTMGSARRRTTHHPEAGTEPLATSPIERRSEAGGTCTSMARSEAEATLFAALEADRRTAKRFELNGRVAVDVGGQPMEIDLLCRHARLAVEVDGYRHFVDAEAYRRDRRKDRELQLNGWLVLRVLADDLAEPAEVDQVVDRIAQTLSRMEGGEQRS